MCCKPANDRAALTAQSWKKFQMIFSVFFREHPNITLIAFNGNKSAAFFKKHVGFDKKYIYTTLPSTSPANAGKSFEQKLAEWKLIKNFINAA